MMHEDGTHHLHYHLHSKMIGNAPSKLRFVRYGFMVSALSWDMMDEADDRFPMLSSSSLFLYYQS